MERPAGRPAPSPEELLAERRWIEGLARRLVRDGNDAGDVAQDAWVKVLSRPPRAVTSLRGWLASVVRSCASDARRGEERRDARERAAGGRREPPVAVPDLVARTEAQRRVLGEVLALEEPYRTAVLLRFLEGMEPVEIAARLGEPPGTVRSRLHRALEILRGRLDGAYGGDRAPWAVALLGPGWARGPATGGTGGAAGAAKGIGGSVAMTTTAKTAAAGAAALLLLGLGGAALFGGGGAPREPGPAARGTGPASGDRPADALPGDAGAPGAGAAPAAGPASASGGHGGAAPEDAAPAAAPAAAAPAVRRLPLEPLPHRDPDPPPRIGERQAVPAGGEEEEGQPPFRITGWTKWKPVPEKGDVVFRGKVVDGGGRPLAGAEVLRVDPKAGGAEGEVVSYEHVLPVAVTGPDGAFEAKGQPARPARLAANWSGVRSRAEGLLLLDLVPVDPAEGQVLRDLLLRIPVNREDFGPLEGRAVDDEGNPLRGVEIAVGMQGALTGRDGRFRIDGVPAGETAVRASRHGWRTWRETVAVAPGRGAAIEAVLAPRRTGPAELAGRVLDEGGLPVAGVPVWCGGVEGLDREGVTDAEGRFRFRRLPDLGEERVCVSVMTDPETGEILPATVQDVRVPTPGLVVRVRRTAPFRLLVRDAATGEVLPLFNVEIRFRPPGGAEGEDEPFRAATCHEEDGAFDLRVPVGRLVLFVEAPDHVPVHAAVTVPRGPGPFEALVEMAR